MKTKSIERARGFKKSKGVERAIALKKPRGIERAIKSKKSTVGKRAMSSKKPTVNNRIKNKKGVKMVLAERTNDVHHIKPRASGGGFVEGNLICLNPVEHMMLHGNYRERTGKIDELKSLMDDRRQIIQIRNKLANQLRAYERRTDNLNHKTEEWLKLQLQSTDKDLRSRDSIIAKAVREYAKGDPLAASALHVYGIAEVTVAHCLVYIDLTKARHASSLWAYAGLDKPSHERYTKGEASGGNKTLRTALFTMADSQIKSRGAYRAVYDNVKTRLANSNKITTTRNTQGQMMDCPWKDTKPSHRDGAAKRAIMKHFLADYWFVGRTLMGLPTSPLYPEAVLGGKHRTIMPGERGWVY